MHQTFDAAIELNLLHANQEGADHNREHFDRWGITCLNIMSSPGAGKNVRQMNKDVIIIYLSGKTGEGLQQWLDWVGDRFWATQAHQLATQV